MEEPIRTYARIKPTLTPTQPTPIQSTPTPAAQKCISVVSSNTVRVTDLHYELTEVFPDTANNAEVFTSTTLPLITHSFNGFNSCVLAYGQTSSGKTHTMKGKENDLGLIPLTVREIFRRITDQQQVARVKVAYFQIYNELIYDLLGEDTPLELREDAKKMVVVRGLQEVLVRNELEAIEKFDMGESKRKYASNSANKESSRSHAIFRITIELVRGNYERVMTHIHMVDLAGSEGLQRSKLRKESESINKSLLALSNAIRSMSEKQTYTNFRDSKLTRILQSSLCMNSRCVVICTVKQEKESFGETLNTIKFGVTAGSVKLVVRKAEHKDGGREMELEEQLRLEREYSVELRDELEELKEASKKEREIAEKVIAKKERDNEKIKTMLVMEEMGKLNEKERADAIERNFQQLNKSLNIFEANAGDTMDILRKDYIALEMECNDYKHALKCQNEDMKRLRENQRVLVDRLGVYDRQLRQLQQIASRKEKAHEPMHVQKKAPTVDFYALDRMPYVPRSDPYTITEVITLSTKILQMKREMHEYVACNAALQEEVNSLTEENTSLTEQLLIAPQADALKELKESKKQPNWEEQARTLRQRLQRMKYQFERAKQKEAKHLRILKLNSTQRLKEIDGFNKYLEESKDGTERKHYRLLTLDMDPDHM